MLTTPPKRARRALSIWRRMLVAATFLLGSLMMLAACANFIERDSLTEISGRVAQVERKQYWEDVVLYLRVEGAQGRFKYERGWPGFDEFESALAKGVPVRLRVDTSSLDMGHPATIYEAEVDGSSPVRFDETQARHNRQTAYVMLLGPIFWFLAFWIWHRATRPLPTAEETAAYQARLEQIAERHWLLFLIVHGVHTVRQWGEKIPKLGGVFTAFLFFWILPLHMAFIYVTAQSYRRIVGLFCISYGILLFALPIAAAAIPGFPGADEYPQLGPIGSRLLNAYILLNIAYGGMIWLWGTLTYESESEVASDHPNESESTESAVRSAA